MIRTISSLTKSSKTETFNNFSELSDTDTSTVSSLDTLIYQEQSNKGDTCILDTPLYKPLTNNQKKIIEMRKTIQKVALLSEIKEKEKEKEESNIKKKNRFKLFIKKIIKN